jgi:redox-sensitive bicupin YhaK (pirin superfamily)
MKKTIHKANDRGYANHGWLKSYHSFSFASYYDPARTHFGLLRVLNDDTVSGGEGFGKHPHENMEIISIPLSGVLEHADSTGTARTLQPGEVQVMSAGSGIFHSEYNGSQSEEVKFLQIWIFPKERNIAPRYDQKAFDDSLFHNKFYAVASANTADGLLLNQDAALSLAKFDADTELTYNLAIKPDNGVYFFVIEGEAEIGGEKLGRRDAIGISEAESIPVKAGKDAYILAIEVPMQ